MTTVISDSTGADLLGDDGQPLSVEILGDVASLPPGSSTALSFFVMELDVYQPGTATQSYALGRGSHPRGALTMLAQALEVSDTLRASDTGYRSRATDAIGLQVFPPTMAQAFEIDRHVGLEPTQASDAAFGSVRLTNLGRRYDAYTSGKNCDSRSIQLLIGTKAYDRSRGIYVDPPYTSLAPFFTGTAQPWKLSEEELEIPLRDATYWADRSLQPNLYAGTGGLNGGSDLTGRPIPMTRGGTSSNPVLNVPLTTVDSVNLIYQWTDAPGTVVALYEGGAAVFTYDGDVSDLYAGTPPAAGHYRTNNARGVLQMGSTPARTLTADVTGAFSGAGAVTTAAMLARYVLTETMGQPLSMVDAASFAAADFQFGYVAGFFANSETAGLDVVRLLLNSIGGRLVTTRSGLLAVCLVYGVWDDNDFTAGKLSPLNATAITTQDLSTNLSPPAYRWRVGYNRVYQVQTSDLNGSITDARKATIGTEYQYATWSSSAVQAAWRRPNDPDPVGTALLNATDAAALAGRIGALWSVRQPKLYAVDMPMTAAAALDMGDAVQLDWPLANLTSRYGMIVGDQTRSFDATTRLLVLA